MRCQIEAPADGELYLSAQSRKRLLASLARATIDVRRR